MNKIVVFDMDETLGYFVEFGMFWDALLKYQSTYKLEQPDFNKILDLYPEFIRPNILSILNYLKHKKVAKECSKVMIYTNNQGPRQWVNYLKDYFETKIKYKLFDQIIGAFKVNGKRVEMCRTTYEKTLPDFIKCTNIPENTQICFLDDLYHPKMVYDNVYYIKVNPYVHDLSIDVMLQRFINSAIGSMIIQKDKDTLAHFIQFMKSYIANYNFVHSVKIKGEYEFDKIMTKKTMIHLQIFFNKRSINKNRPIRSITKNNRNKNNNNKNNKNKNAIGKTKTRKNK